MVWGWSHTDEAYENGKRNLNLFSIEDLAVILAEISASNWYKISIGESVCSDFDSDLYDRRLARHRLRSKDELTEKIWNIAEKMRNCDNGGFDLWVCPHGCHTVSATLDPQIVCMELLEDLENLSYPDHPVIAIDSCGNDCYAIYHTGNVISFYTRIDDSTSTHYSDICHIGLPYQDTFESYLERYGIDIADTDIDSDPYTITTHSEVDYTAMDLHGLGEKIND